MLEYIRRYKGFFSIIFVLACAGLVVSTFGTGPMVPGGGAVTGVVAKVGDEEVKTQRLIQVINQEAQRMEELMSQQSNGDPEQERFMRMMMQQQLSAPRILEQLVYQSFMYSTASEMGFHSSPESIRDIISEYPQFQTDGKFDPLLYRQLVPRPALVEASFARQVVIDHLNSAFRTGLGIVSESDLETQRWLASSWEFETVQLAAEKMPPPSKPTAAQLEEFANDSGTQARLQAYYNRNISLFVTEEEVRARHILIGEDSEKSAADVLAEINAGTISFEDAAKKYSTDKSNSDRGGDLGFFRRGVMVPEFEQAAFALTADSGIAGPVKTQFGEHLIEFVEKKDKEEQTLDEVKEEIMEDVWLETEADAKLAALVDEWTGSEKGPSSAELKKYGLEWTTADAWTPSQTFFAPIGSVDTYLEDLVSLTEAQPFLGKAIPRGRDFVFVRLKSFTEASDDSVNAQSIAQQRAQEAFEYFVQTRYDAAKESKQIVIQEETVQEIQTALQQQQAR